MSTVKISELNPFTGQKLLLEAQRRGCEIVLGTELGLSADIILIGLAAILVERGIVKEKKD